MIFYGLKYKKDTNTPIIHNNAVFSIVFRDKFD